MIPSLLRALLVLSSVGALAALPIACGSGSPTGNGGGGGTWGTSGSVAGVGDPCTPEAEHNAAFGGFNLAQENIETGSSQCSTRVCLVNHLQGRVSCPAGQAQPAACLPNNPASCPSGKTCVLAETYAPACAPCAAGDPNCADTCLAAGFMTPCDGTAGRCTCKTSMTIGGVPFFCEPEPACTTANCPLFLHTYACHTPGDCQASTDTVAAARGKDCCVPGADTPVLASVCGQCNSASRRDADQAAYCSCRCCAPCCPPCAGGGGDLCLPAGDDPTSPSCSTDKSTCGPACDPNFDYCTCPSGFSCVGIRPNVGLGDPDLDGAYCIKTGTAYLPTSAATCGAGAQGGFVADLSCAP